MTVFAKRTGDFPVRLGVLRFADLLSVWLWEEGTFLDQLFQASQDPASSVHRLTVDEQAGEGRPAFACEPLQLLDVQTGSRGLRLVWRSAASTVMQG